MSFQLNVDAMRQSHGVPLPVSPPKAGKLRRNLRLVLGSIQVLVAVAGIWGLALNRAMVSTSLDNVHLRRLASEIVASKPALR